MELILDPFIIVHLLFKYLNVKVDVHMMLAVLGRYQLRPSEFLSEVALVKGCLLINFHRLILPPSLLAFCALNLFANGLVIEL